MQFSAIVALLATTALAQVYVEPNTGISFYNQNFDDEAGPNGFSFGIALPGVSQTQYQDEYIGHLVVGLVDGAGWGGLAHGGSMTNNLLLIAWPNAGQVITSFRWATGYVQPDLYTGNATLTPIYQSVNDTIAEIVYRCQNCWVWSQTGGSSGSQIPSNTTGNQVIGWAAATVLPSTPADPDSLVAQHPYYDIGVAPAASARNTAYTNWILSATATPTATSTASATATTTTAVLIPSCTKSTAPTGTYDYIIAGAGAAGIPLAAKLSESGKQVLLIERGPPSSGRFGGTMKPAWLDGTNLTRFDVPGLCNQIWHDSAGIACDDVPTMSGCVLGGGTAVNAGLWWNPTPADFDQVFPAGWHYSEVQQSIYRVFSKIPGTYVPSMDGKTYLRNDYNQIASALTNAGWTSIDANANPSEKNHTFTQTPYMFINGERGGPMATYLVEASARSNFKIIYNTSVRRVLRNGANATGVELEPYNSNGLCGTVSLKTNGKAILSAGTYGTTKILLRSGIGPTDQLQIVANSAQDGKTMIPSSQWINLPVGHNLIDHTNTNMVVQYNKSTFYDFYAAYTDPNTTDTNMYLTKREGILAQAAPNIGPIIFDLVTGSDGIQRQLMYTSRVEGADKFPDNTSITMSQYLGRGKTSRGQLGLNPDLTISILQYPWVNTDGDVSAIIQGIKNIKAAIATNKNLNLVFPDPSITVESFVNNYVNTTSERTANHWVGTAKMGTDSGLNGGTSVVDITTKVYGTNNIYVVDGSLFPGMPSTNPSALIVTIAERAYEYIVAA